MSDAVEIKNMEIAKAFPSDYLPQRAPKTFYMLTAGGFIKSYSGKYTKKLTECRMKAFSCNNPNEMIFIYMALYYDWKLNIYYCGTEEKNMKLYEDAPEEFNKKIKLDLNHIGIFDGEEINRMDREQGGNGKGNGLYDYLLRAYNINEEKMRKKSERKAAKLAKEKNKTMRYISGLNGKHEKENWRGMNL